MISIHAPTRGATKKPQTLRRRWGFQSTLLQEERRYYRLHRDTFCNFNPRSYKRSDMSNVFFMIGLFISIHAPTRGATRKQQSGILKSRNFNPRSYKRSDGNWDPTEEDWKISIHAPTRGATVKDFVNSVIQMFISIHAPTRGATMQNKKLQSFCKFQSTLLQEERLVAAWSVVGIAVISIHAPTRGATAKMHNNPYTYL
mgnify:CR=1 FL=1